MRSEFLPFALPTVDETDVEEVADVVRSGWLTSGPRTQKFEVEAAAELGTSSALAVASGTGAMQLALTVLRPPPESWVITSPMTFCSTAHVIEHVGCRPLFVDVESDTLNLDPEQVAAALEGARGPVGAILPVHYAGHPVELDRILDLARRHDVPVVEDAAHAFGARFRGTPIGAIEASDTHRAVAFSLYATKNITSGEGGILTAGDDIVRQARLWSLHGMSRDSWQRYGPRGSWEYEVVVPGLKENMTDIQAALASSQMRRWREFQRRRTEIAALYTELFRELDEVEAPVARPHVEPAWHLYPVRLCLDALTIDRAAFIDELRRRNIGTSVHFIPLHLQPYYRDRYGWSRDDFPVTVSAFDRLVSLPIYPRMTDGDVHDVVAAVQETVLRHRVVTR